MKTLFILAFLLSACATPSRVWVLKESKTGGVVGYVKNSDTDEELHEKIRAVMVCPATFDWVSDEMGSQQYTYTTVQQVENSRVGRVTSGAARADYKERSTSSVPVTQTGVSTWREFTYRCP
jgi:hypothetical protein